MQVYPQRYMLASLNKLHICVNQTIELIVIVMAIILLHVILDSILTERSCALSAFDVHVN